VPGAAPPSIVTFASDGKAISGEIRHKYPALILLHEQQNNSFGITLLQVIGLKVAPNHTLAKKVGGGVGGALRMPNETKAGYGAPMGMAT
jgi:hypothetical protein